MDMDSIIYSTHIDHIPDFAIEYAQLKNIDLGFAEGYYDAWVGRLKDYFALKEKGVGERLVISSLQAQKIVEGLVVLMEYTDLKRKEEGNEVLSLDDFKRE